MRLCALHPTCLKTPTRSRSDAGVSGLARLIELAGSGDEDARKAFHEAGRVLGYGIARVVAMIDPKRLVLTGAAMRAFAFMEKGMWEGLEEALVADLREQFLPGCHALEREFHPQWTDCAVDGAAGQGLPRQRDA